MALFPPNRFEHFGINVVDIDRMERFYCDTFGFVASDRGVRFNGSRIVFLTKSAADHHQLVLIDGRPPEATYSTVNQVSFAFNTLDDLREVFRRLPAIGATDVMQVNHGNSWSLYAKDPEGNPLELFVDSPWHTPQPCRGDLDITQPTDLIMRETEALCRSHPGFATREDWSAGMAARIDAARAG